MQLAKQLIEQELAELEEEESNSAETKDSDDKGTNGSTATSDVKSDDAGASKATEEDMQH